MKLTRYLYLLFTLCTLSIFGCSCNTYHDLQAHLLPDTYVIQGEMMLIDNCDQVVTLPAHDISILETGAVQATSSQLKNNFNDEPPHYKCWKCHFCYIGFFCPEYCHFCGARMK